jgi:hypothetical protein
MNYQIVPINELTPEQQSWVPPLAERQAIRIGDTVRLFVKLEDITP